MRLIYFSPFYTDSSFFTTLLVLVNELIVIPFNQINFMSEAEKNRIIYLIQQFSKRLASQVELEELTGILQVGRHDEQIKSFLEEMAMETTVPIEYSSDRLDEILAGMQDKLNIGVTEVKDQSPVISFNTKRRKSSYLWIRVAVAASIILMAGISTYLFYENKKDNNVVQTVSNAGDIKAPEANRAMVTLADGRTVYLDDALNGQLAIQGSVQLVKLSDGQIVYQPSSGSISDQIQYNTLSNPRGSKVIDIQLADGSRVWLNAGSTITYPTSFAGINERIVEMTGEGYFEVAKNEGKSFKVRMPQIGEVEVLGTQFNINSYSNEPYVSTTLMEGSIKISSHKKDRSVVLIPGQQVQINTNGQISFNSNPDLQSVMAWKENKFMFQNADLYTIMRQLERWYDIDVSYKGEKYSDQFVGVISRNVNISEILKILEKTGNVKFELNGRQVIVQ